MPRLLPLVLFALLFAESTPARAAEWGPYRTDAAPVTKDARAEVRRKPSLPSSDPFWFAFQVYQATLSSQDGPRCAHYPTCSLYGVQAVRRHKVLGFGLTVDRLWRTVRSSELRPLPITRVGRLDRYWDPLDAADFWLRGIPHDHAPEYAPPAIRQ